MTEAEYKEKLIECVSYKKWQVVADAVNLLNIMNDNYEAIISEFKSDRRAIIKALESDMSNKRKLDFIKSFVET